MSRKIIVPDRWHVRTDAEKAALAQELAERALMRPYPKKSLASYLREGGRAGVRQDLLDEIEGLAVDHLARALAGSTAAQDPHGWLTLTQAAQILGKSLKWVREALETPDGRRVLGFPWFDGQRWRIPRDACCPSTRAQYLARLPETEPGGNIALLKPDIEQGRTSGSASPDGTEE